MHDELIAKMKQYAATDMLPLHMPGHKRRPLRDTEALPYAIDYTEIEGFDNLHAANGLLLSLRKRLAEVYGSLDAFALINGSTCGILAAVRAYAPEGSTVLCARNCHKAVWNAAELARVKTAFLLPPTDEETGIFAGVSPATVEAALKEHPDTSLVIITSPTYEGVTSDIGAIAAAAHRHGAYLLVDAAHGAHFGFHPSFPPFAGAAGGDIVITSLHKTLPSLTQTAAALLYNPALSPDALARELSVFETSSPSYPLLASISACVAFLSEQRKGDTAFEEYATRLEMFSLAARQLRHLKILCVGKDSPAAHPLFHGFDSSKLYISAEGISGVELARLLRERFHIETEMTAPGAVLAMTSVCDGEETFARLTEALFAIDSQLGNREAQALPLPAPTSLPPKVAEPFEMRGRVGELIRLSDARGAVSLTYLWAYPPGIPLLMPGERVTEELLLQIRRYEEIGIPLFTPDGELSREAGEPLLRALAAF